MPKKAQLSMVPAAAYSELQSVRLYRRIVIALAHGLSQRFAVMLLLFVQIRVKPECLEAFRSVTLENASNSRLEDACVRFDVVQEMEDPTRFALLEVYRSPEGHAVHRDTAHFKAWAAAAEPMMVEPRTRVRYSTVSPDDSAW